MRRQKDGCFSPVAGTDAAVAGLQSQVGFLLFGGRSVKHNYPVDMGSAVHTVQDSPVAVGIQYWHTGYLNPSDELDLSRFTSL